MAGSRGPKALPNRGRAQRGSPGIEGLIWREEGNWQHGWCWGRRQVWGPRSKLELSSPGRLHLGREDMIACLPGESIHHSCHS